MSRTISTDGMARLLRRCAEAMDGEDRRRIEAGEVHFRSAVSHPTVAGREACERAAGELAAPEWGELAYYLLVYSWNDVLDWSDRIDAPAAT